MTKSKITLLALSLLLADQLTKLCVAIYLVKPVKIIGDFLTLEKSLNPGIAFGIQLNPKIVLILSLVVILFVLKVAKTELNFSHRSTKLAFALILSGALGNIIDRLIRGEVIDFIAFNFWPSFNLADAFIVTGVAMTIIFQKTILKHHSKPRT